MKSTFIFPILNVSASILSGDGSGLRTVSRRYTDLLSIVLHYNPDFDQRKYWAYGCNCLMLGDRPMSESGKWVVKSGLSVQPFFGDSDIDDKIFSTSVTKNVKTLVKVRGNRWMSWMQHVNNISSVRNVPECSLERYIWNSHCKSY